VRTVRFFEGATTWPFARQSPAGDGVFGNTQFYFGPGPEQADWLVVLNEIPEGMELRFPPDRTLFLSGEPPSIRSFEPQYLAQFGTAIAANPQLPHRNLVVAPPVVPWHVGIRSREPEAYGDAMTFAHLETAPQKSKLCSCIVSRLHVTDGHRARLDFAHRLRDELGDRIDFFGRGLNTIADKNEGLEPYRYHIAIENSAVPHYWTEKLADPILRNCFPIYAGAPDIADYFDPASMTMIDIARPAEAIEKIAAILDSDTDSRAASAVAEAKRRVMWEHNMLARIDRFIDAAEQRGALSGEPRLISPESRFVQRRPMQWLLDIHGRVLAASRRRRDDRNPWR
jgi:hypothetical protein